MRQALVQLEAMGIVIRERNKGATVRSLTHDEVRQIYAVRELVQRQAALWIPLPAPDALIEELTAIHREYSRHVDAEYLRGVHETNDRFHLTLFGACGNDYLVETIELYMRSDAAGACTDHGEPGVAQRLARASSHDDRDDEGPR